MTTSTGRDLMDLPEPLLAAVIQRLPDADLVSLRATHTTLKRLVDAQCKLRFCERWGIVDILEAPRCAPLYLAARATHFAWQHELGPHDTLASVALKYGCDLVVLRRYNNLMSEAGVPCRTKLFVPVKDIQEVEGCCAAFVRCQHVGRRFVVTFVPGTGPGPNKRHQSRFTPQSASDKLLSMLERGLHIDRSTAQYYLTSYAGSLRDAIANYEQDLRWSQRARSRRAH